MKTFGRIVAGILLLGTCAVSQVSVGEPRSPERNPPESLQKLASDFWEWRATNQPYSTDDIPRIERPHALALEGELTPPPDASAEELKQRGSQRLAGQPDWSAAGIARQRKDLAQLEGRWNNLDIRTFTVAEQVDYRLIGSAIARVHWELDVNRRWERDPTFYVQQALTPVAEALLQPPPFDSSRTRDIVARMANVCSALGDGDTRQFAAPFATLALDSLDDIGPKLRRVGQAVAPLLGSPHDFDIATDNAIHCLERYRQRLQSSLPRMGAPTAVGREGYTYFLRYVALIPYTPEQMLAMGRQEFQRAVAFEQYEKQRDQDVPPLRLAANTEEQIRRTAEDELAIRKFLEEKALLTVPKWVKHYTVRAIPGYLDVLGDFTEQDDFTGPSRLNQDCVRWIYPPSPHLGYFALATAKDPRPEIVHEGVPGHYLQLTLSWHNPDPIRRHFYDSGANEGIGFYAEEMMLQAGLFDDSPRSREIIYNFMRLRALRVEVDVKLALGMMTLQQAADYLARNVPMDRKTALAEAAAFASTPGQAISYQIGKIQITQFLAEAHQKQGDAFSLRAFHDFLWNNGNVPIALQRWELLGLDDQVGSLQSQPERGSKHPAPTPTQ